MKFKPLQSGWEDDTELQMKIGETLGDISTPKHLTEDELLKMEIYRTRIICLTDDDPNYVEILDHCLTGVLDSDEFSVIARLYFIRVLLEAKIQITYKVIPEFKDFVSEMGDIVCKSVEMYRQKLR